MKIIFEFNAQLKENLGMDTLEKSFDSSLSLQDAIKALSQEKGKTFDSFVYDEKGDFASTIMLAINDNQVFWDQNPELKDGDRLSVLAPMSGG